MRIDADHHIVIHAIASWDGSDRTWRGGQCNYRQSRPLLSHNLTGWTKSGRRPFASQNATGDGSRFASEPNPVQTPEDLSPRTPAPESNKLPIR